MAKTVYDVQEITLQDGKEVKLTPLPIGLLRRFMKAWEKFADIETDEESFDVYINCAGIALERDFKEEFEKTRDNEKTLTDEYREYLEGVLDMDTIYKILEVCGGLKLNDPKVLEAAAAAAAAAAKDGTN